jgi:hypothetical protein
VFCSGVAFTSFFYFTSFAKQSETKTRISNLSYSLSLSLSLSRFLPANQSTAAGGRWARGVLAFYASLQCVKLYVKATLSYYATLRPSAALLLPRSRVPHPCCQRGVCRPLSNLLSPVRLMRVCSAVGRPHLLSYKITNTLLL